MSRTISSRVHRSSAAWQPRNPSAWCEGLVVAADGSSATVALLNGATVQLRIVGPAIDIVVGEPVAYHPVAVMLSASAMTTTARGA